tara:strand:+ start:10 stop:192 length:183 start_codon:yes stop_codon:yes gene_type:complete
MSENIKQDIMVCGSGTDYKDYGRQSFDYQTDRITTVTTSDIHTGDLPGSKTLRLHRKIYW